MLRRSIDKALTAGKAPAFKLFALPVNYGLLPGGGKVHEWVFDDHGASCRRP
jgi:hypothetical protein